MEARKTFSKLLTKIRSGRNSETKGRSHRILRGGQGSRFGHVMILRADATRLPAHRLFAQQPPASGSERMLQSTMTRTFGLFNLECLHPLATARGLHWLYLKQRSQMFSVSVSPLFLATVCFSFFCPEDPARTVLVFLTRCQQTLFFETSARAAVDICEQALGDVR